MTKDKIRLVHALARQKGLDREEYEMRLQAYGVASCKDFKRAGFDRFIKDLKTLPDVRRSANDETGTVESVGAA